MLRSYARLSERQYDLILGFPWQQDEALDHAARGIPGRSASGLAAHRQPLRRVHPGCRAKGIVTAHASLVVRTQRVAKSDYAAFRRFCRDVDGAVGQQLVIADE